MPKRHDITWWLRLSVVVFVIAVVIIVYIQLKTKREFLTLREEAKRYAQVHATLTALEDALQKARACARLGQEKQCFLEQHKARHQVVLRLLAAVRDTMNDRKALANAIVVDARRSELLLHVNAATDVHQIIETLHDQLPELKFEIAYLKMTGHGLEALLQAAPIFSDNEARVDTLR